jgi:membrane protein required for colicin V production
VADIGGIPWFDVIVVLTIIVSAVMSLGRGLIREASSLVAFAVGVVIAMLAMNHLAPLLQPILPASWGRLGANVITLVVGFLSSYALAAFLGGRLARLIHASPEIGVIDRLAGAAFGAARGVLACVLFVLLTQQLVPAEATPAWLGRSQSYAYLDVAASWIRDNVPGFVDRAVATVAPADASRGTLNP